MKAMVFNGRVFVLTFTVSMRNIWVDLRLALDHNRVKTILKINTELGLKSLNQSYSSRLNQQTSGLTL